MSEITKNQIKHIRLLQQKKYRQEYCQFVVEGEKNVNELMNSKFEVDVIYATSDWKEEFNSQETVTITNKQLSQMSNLSSPDKILALAKIPTNEFDKNIISKGLTLVLEGVNDPGNLGTILRTADWYGIKNVICSKNSVDCYNPKVVQSTKGSLFRTSVFYCDLKEILENVKIPIYGAVLGGTEINSTTNLVENSVLIMGSESHGISDEILKFVTDKISIKRFGNAESLNVAIATSVLISRFIDN